MEGKQAYNASERPLPAPLPPGVIQLLGNVTSLWSFAKHLERVLPLPWLSNLGVFLVSGVLGAVTSANLNAYYVSCGASGGICGLLGASGVNAIERRCRCWAGQCCLVLGSTRPTVAPLAAAMPARSWLCWLCCCWPNLGPPPHAAPIAAGGVWADQLFNWKQYSRRLVGVLTLVLTTAVFVAVSLLPLLDPWFVAGSLVAGFCCTTILLLVNTVRRGWGARLGCQGAHRMVPFGAALCMTSYQAVPLAACLSGQLLANRSSSLAAAACGVREQQPARQPAAAAARRWRRVCCGDPNHLRHCPGGRRCSGHCRACGQVQRGPGMRRFRLPCLRFVNQSFAVGESLPGDWFYWTVAATPHKQ